MIFLAVQFALFLFNAVGTVMLQRSRRRWGWIVLAASQLLWIIYAAMTQQFVFVVSSIIYFGIFTRGAIVEK